MTTLQQRLRWCQKRGNLTVADLARWLDRPYPTVRTWVENGSEPGGGPVDAEAVYGRLATLESLINGRPAGGTMRFPVPRLSPKGRIAYLKKTQQLCRL